MLNYIFTSYVPSIVHSCYYSALCSCTCILLSCTSYAVTCGYAHSYYCATASYVLRHCYCCHVYLRLLLSWLSTCDYCCHRLFHLRLLLSCRHKPLVLYCRYLQKSQPLTTPVDAELLFRKCMMLFCEANAHFVIDFLICTIS